jgi:alpha-tubulin suppressor-like RCC1 family protein
MKSLAHASVGAVAVCALLIGAPACWKLAPNSGTLPDGSADGTTDGTAYEGSIIESSADHAAGDAGDAGDAAETGPVMQPYASAVIAAGLDFGCTIDGQGSVLCWGDNTYGQAGGPPSSTAVAHPQVVPIDAVDAGSDAGDAGDAGDASAGLSATAIALGDRHACAITSSQAVYCWGLNDAYQLGHASASDGDQICPGASPGQTLPCTGTPTLVAGIDSAVSIGASGAWTCVVTATGTVQCWGASQVPGVDGGVGCGLGVQEQGGSCYSGFYAVGGLSGATQLAVAYDHACATLTPSAADAGASVECWGNNNEGQVSPSACPGSDCTTPIARTDLSSTTGVAAGNAFSCALESSGAVDCFGDNTYGQLGHLPGTSGDMGQADLDAGLGVYNLTATPVAGLGTATSLVGGGNASACALVSGGVDCWGDVAGASAAGTPVTITGLPAMAALGSYDGPTACGLATDGGLWCWSLANGGPAVQVQ